MSEVVLSLLLSKLIDPWAPSDKLSQFILMHNNAGYAISRKKMDIKKKPP